MFIDQNCRPVLSTRIKRILSKQREQVQGELL